MKTVEHKSGKKLARTFHPKLLMDCWLSKLHERLTPKRLRYPIWIGAALWLSWIISLLLGSGNTDAAGHLIGTDFVAFYTAGKILLMGQSENLYDLTLAHQIQQPLYGAPSENFNPYLNPPFYAWLFIPFAGIPYPWSPILWMASNLGVFWLSMKLLTPHQSKRPFLWALTWQPAFAAISFGQNAFLSLALFCMVYLLMKQERRFASGLVAGLLLYKPQLLLGLGFLWLLNLRKNWRAFMGVATTALLLTGSSLLWMPEAVFVYIRYTQKIAVNLMTVPGFPIWNAHSVQAFWLGLFPGSVNLAVGLHIVCAAAGVWFFWTKRDIFQENFTLGFCAAVCLTIWVTPYIMVYDWVLLLLPAVLFWQIFPQQQNDLRIFYALIWVVMFLSSALTFAQWTIFDRAFQLSIPALGLICVTLIRRLAPLASVKDTMEHGA
jgi:alpha-1,2-mannosyltransferase